MGTTFCSSPLTTTDGPELASRKLRMCADTEILVRAGYFSDDNRIAPVPQAMLTAVARRPVFQETMRSYASCSSR